MLETSVPLTASIATAKTEEFVKSVESTYGWSRTSMITTGNVVAIQFKPTSVTYMSACEHLLSLDAVLEIEFRPDGWWVSFLHNKNSTSENPIRQLKRREPQRFRGLGMKKTGSVAGKSS